MEKWSRSSMVRSILIDMSDGVSGEWSVSTFTVSEEDEKFGRIRSVISSNRGRYVPAGTYKRLIRGGTTIMSNTPDEIRDQYPFFRVACGNVLINGLGLGITLKAILNKVDEEGNLAVKSVTVIEMSTDVISLVASHYTSDSRVSIINSDALTYSPPKGVVYDAVWHDIWDGICSDNLEQMKTLHRKYGRRTKWQGSWCRGQCEMYRDRVY